MDRNLKEFERRSTIDPQHPSLSSRLLRLTERAGRKDPQRERMKDLLAQVLDLDLGCLDESWSIEKLLKRAFLNDKQGPAPFLDNGMQWTSVIYLSLILELEEELGLSLSIDDYDRPTNLEELISWLCTVYEEERQNETRGLRWK
jgi:acyl carrier protein